MTDLAFSAPRPALLPALLGLLPIRRARPAADATRARRARLAEMFDRCPGALTGEHDIHALMALYPRDF